MLTFEENYPVFSKFCKKLLKNISEIKSNYDLCEYIYYWIYGQLWNMFSTYFKNTYNMDVVAKLLYVVYSIIYKLNFFGCEHSYNHNMPLDILEEMRDLHDYFRNYDHIFFTSLISTKNIVNLL